ncbi:hypothetical protein [Flavobacterium hydatis]|jgi:hypothetical protein|uniref:Uncharacterized protein n=1 Tax=Flavobacterium hydatis TaxID=991 RepID=A0A086AKZ4_FLAHY|nr:hypothetical protein [Flavobacterium hydatis]KFF17358.1 hypothetical protein IW20_08440 [Flavobacterium hydatis]OXA97344.1 hypothetical protein B0A62_03590 [Flavobacterium hydatis]
MGNVILGEPRFKKPEKKEKQIGRISSSAEGDYFDIQGKYLGSTANSQKKIYIIGRDSLRNKYSMSNIPDGFFDKQVSFIGTGNIVNLRAGTKYGTIITDLSLQTRINVAENVYNHYYTEAGYSLNELKYKTITDATNDPSNTGYAVTKFGGVTSDSEYLKDREADIRIVYGHIGLNFDTGYDIMSVCAHEYKHLEELRRLGVKFYDDEYFEDVAYRHQAFVDKNWKYVSIGFRNAMVTMMNLKMKYESDYIKAKGDNEQYKNFKGWKAGKNITL